MEISASGEVRLRFRGGGAMTSSMSGALVGLLVMVSVLNVSGPSRLKREREERVERRGKKSPAVIALEVSLDIREVLMTNHKMRLGGVYHRLVRTAKSLSDDGVLVFRLETPGPLIVAADRSANSLICRLPWPI